MGGQAISLLALLRFRTRGETRREDGRQDGYKLKILTVRWRFDTHPTTNERDGLNVRDAMLTVRVFFSADMRQSESEGEGE